MRKGLLEIVEGMLGDEGALQCKIILDNSLALQWVFGISFQLRQPIANAKARTLHAGVRVGIRMSCLRSDRGEGLDVQLQTVLWVLFSLRPPL